MKPTTASNSTLPSLPVMHEGPWARSAYLPLEYWRAPTARPLFRGGAEVRSFRSSGTTGAQRSTSRFTAAGLAAYQAQSVAHFLEVLASALPPAGAGEGSPLAAAFGISLIPSVADWPESSLAQMVAWLGEVLPLRYSDGVDLDALLQEAQGRPVWLFGTAFHLLNVIDAGLARPLPKGSVVVETGGTKGKAREVTRPELYRDLASSFAIPEAAIISEYGMCELACQAYDAVPYGQELPLAERRFRFPAWVELAVMSAPGVAAKQGRGALIIRDPLRLDAPWPLRTEDLAELTGGSFQLLGRAPSQPLKGCSLQVEELQSAPLPAPSAEAVLLTADPEAIKTRAKPLGTLLSTWCADPANLKLLAAELGSEAAAREALADVAACLPQTPVQWAEAALQAAAHTAYPRDWLFILPANHSVVGLYPLALAYLLGLKVRARLPARFAAPGNLLTSFIAALQALPGSDWLSAAAPSLRIGAGAQAAKDLKDLAVSAILAYGSDATIDQLRLLAGVPVKGFGGRIGLSIVAADQLASAELAQDLVGLGQKGCMATRLVLVVGEPEPSALMRSCRTWWNADLPWQDLVGLDYESLRQRGLGATMHLPEDRASPLIAMHRLDPAAVLSDEAIDAWIARAPFTAALLILEPSQAYAAASEILACLARRQALGTITTALAAAAPALDQRLSCLIKSRYKMASLRALGQANRQRWDGLHENEPLFAGFAANFLSR